MKKNTIRFAELVKTSGRPQILTLWSSPGRDVELAKAIHDNRVVTLKQVNVGTKKDFGLVGFFKQRQSAFLIFPKPIEPAAGTKVIGIKYELIETPKPADPVSLDERARYDSKSKSKPPVRSTAQRKKTEVTKFEIVFEVTATLQVPLSVEAADPTEARKKAESMLAGEQLDFSNARTKTRVRMIKRDS
jgi:hypothetical protein